jgi:hypothetical protein
MAANPAEGPVADGLVAEEVTLLRFESPSGDPLLGLVHVAAHPCTVDSLHVSADYPGELRRRLTAQEGHPFIFLLGAAANLNPPFRDMTRAEMLRNVSHAMDHLAAPAWEAPAGVEALNLQRSTLQLHYGRLPDPAQLREWAAGMTQIAETGRGPADVESYIANILNVPPGESAPPDLLRHFATVMRDWAESTLARVDAGKDAPRLPLAVLQLGDTRIAFVGGEVFLETALAVAETAGGKTLVVSNLAPSVGYLPTDEALDQGGYEVDDAWRFYDHPAPYRRGTEARVREGILQLASSPRD